MPIEVSESLIRAITTKDKALSDGRTLVKKGSFQRLGRLSDDSLLWGQCQGSGAKPYEISVDLVGDNPTMRCSCPVKPPPCKHILGMLLSFVEKRERFVAGEPDATLLDKRARNVERADKKAEAAAKPRESSSAAQEKKTRAQREALDLLEKLVVDIAASGLATLDAKKAGRIVEQARQMNDAYLPGAAEALRRLASLCEPRDEGASDGFWGDREPGSDLPDELRHRLMLRHLTRLWAMIRRGQKVLDERLEEGESRADADAVVEDLLGRIWELGALKAAGYWKQRLDLFELADERYRDHVRQERIEQSWLLDLEGGAILVDRKFRPLAALDKVGEKPSYDRPLSIDEAGLYPGFVNRRVRWELKSYHERKAFAPADFERLHALALPIEQAVARYKEQIKNPLAPDEAVLLVGAADIQRAGDALVAIDGKGARLVLRDSAITRYPSTNNLEMAAGASLEGGRLRAPASLLLRLYLGLDDDAIYGQPMALVCGTTFTRLCM